MSDSSTKYTQTVASLIPETMPKVWQVAKLIAYDNGMINRTQSEDEYLGHVADIVANRPVITVLELETALNQMNNIELNIIAAGEYLDSQKLIQTLPDPEFADALFNAFFEGE